ncbi:MAG: LacI family DNA-binding transcriptional regulator [Pseudomonadales bacterium]
MAKIDGNGVDRAMQGCKRVQKNKPTVRDVAKLAQTSTATVSRYFNTPDAVRPKLRERIEVAIAELNYLPHSAARALNTNETRTVGAIVPTLAHALFAQAQQGLQQTLAKAGYTLLSACSNFDPQEEEAALSAMLSKGVDAVMLVGALHTDRVYDLLQRYAVPYVNTWVYDASSQHPSIGFDNQQISAQVADYLQDLGHRRIAVITGLLAHNDRTQARLQGVQSALQARGNELAAQCIIEREFSVAAGREAFIQLMSQAEPVTAIICGSDLFAIGALLEAQRMGINVPQSVSITGFDNMELAAQFNPGLTTVQIPSLEMGEAAADHLLARLAGKDVAQHRELEATLVVRGTTAALLRR